MPTARDMAWFKAQFHANVAAATAGTPFDLSMIAALASQETGHIWGPLSRKGALTTQEILDVCVGDVITGPGRTAFPTSSAGLMGHANGAAMYALARRELANLATRVPSWSKYVQNPERFCHGYGILQADIQHFKTTPDYFLKREWANIDKALARCVTELKTQQSRIPSLKGKATLTDLERCAVAIAYNTGGFNPKKGLKQGYFNKDDGLFYGELFHNFLKLARSVSDPVAGAAQPAPAPKPAAGQALVPPPSPITAGGDVYRVDTVSDPLMLREEPDKTATIKARLPDNQLVRAFGEPERNGFLRVETSLNGARFEGWAFAKLLVRQPAAATVPVVTPASRPPTKGPVAVYAPSGNTVTRRRDVATARSLNEPDQPGRKGTTVAARVSEIDAIIDWLDSENPAHRRYAPRDGLTFCNIYAHDFCHLAGVFIPRVWWTGTALVQLGQGRTVVPSVGQTVLEVRANQLLDWLDDFGPTFGWRQTSSLTTLQEEANQGAIGLIVGRRVNSKGPGHIVVVAPETDQVRARRDAAGQVVQPVQSQAGARNIRRAALSPWWTIGPKFEANAFWLHA